MFLVGRNPAETAERRIWARRIARVGLQLFAESAYDEELRASDNPRSAITQAVLLRRRGRQLPIPAAEQTKRRAFIALLWRKRVIRQWVIHIEGLEPMEMEAPSGAPLFIEGDRWNDFAAELAALPTD